MDTFGMPEDFDLSGFDGKHTEFQCIQCQIQNNHNIIDLINNYNAEMPEVNTKLFTEDSILSEFDDPMNNSTLLDFPSLDLPQIEPDIQMLPAQVVTPITDKPVMDNRSPSGMLKPCQNTVPLVKPNRKLVEKPIQPNYIIEQNVDKQIRYIQKPRTRTLVPVKSLGQIQLPSDHQMKQVLYIYYLYIIFL